MKFENHFRYPVGEVCIRCNSDDICEWDVDEVNGMAVGPYTIRQCEECGMEWVVEELGDKE